LNLVPAGVLPLPAPSAVDEFALVGTSEWMRVPSATILTRLRRRSKPGNGFNGSGVLAIATGETPSGEALPGARQEVRTIARRYRGVDLRLGPRDEHLDEILDRYDVVHVAAHTETHDQSPWKSAIHLGRGAGPADLRAEQIARMKLPARLVVLSSCESAGGRVVSGEGVQGLTSAFLSAGVPAVVATLWPVDDRAAETLMARFYRELSRGRSVAASLRAAQASVRHDRATSHPFYWAGFVLVGDGEIRIDLRRRSGFDRALPIGLGLLAVVAVILRLRARSRKPPGGA
jgi:CHAT domain-containing protein